MAQFLTADADTFTGGTEPDDVYGLDGADLMTGAAATTRLPLFGPCHQ